MAFITHPRVRGAVRSIVWAGRNGRLHLKQEPTSHEKGFNYSSGHARGDAG